MTYFHSTFYTFGFVKLFQFIIFFNYKLCRFKYNLLLLGGVICMESKIAVKVRIFNNLTVLTYKVCKGVHR